MHSPISVVDTIVIVASWEPRFVLGIGRLLRRYSTNRVLMYFMSEYRNRTAPARDQVGQLLADRHNIRVEEQELYFGMPEVTWRTVEKQLGPSSEIRGTVLVDFTTMPRDILWSALFWLEASGMEVHYAYSRPEAYARDWLARDPNDPRFVFKLAGILEIDRPTALVAVTGFDENRCRQAIEFYEPNRVLLATQGGEQFDNTERNVGWRFGAGGIKVDRVIVDAYSCDHGYESLRAHVERLTVDHNVIMCSFGPKPSAIALYRLQREFPQTALAYIGCKEYNPRYSRGIGELLAGQICWSGV